MNVRGQSSLKGAYLLLILAGLWLVPTLVVAFSPLRAQALVPELFGSGKLKQANLSIDIKKTTSYTSSLFTSRDNSSSSVNKTSPDKGDKSKVNNSSDTSTTSAPSTKTTTPTGSTTSVPTPKQAATYPTLSLVAKPLKAVTLPAATLVSAGAAPVPSPVVLTDGRPRLVVLEPSDEGWRVFGVAWYWWVAMIILGGGGAIATREFRRVTKTEETWA